MMRFDPTLYVITDRAIGHGRPLEDLVAAATRGGATAIQFRDKAQPARAMLETGRRLVEITRHAGVPLIVNDRLDVALVLDADGVHVGQDDIPVAEARRILGPRKIVGASAATVDEARQAEADGADYLGVGSIFPTPSKPDAGQAIGPAALRPIKAAVAIPVVAIGGIDHANAGAAIRAGADGIAVISAVMAAEDVAGAARRLLEAVLAARG
jgi:thiamine-phosphate pyrophosphorylase